MYFHKKKINWQAENTDCSPFSFSFQWNTESVVASHKYLSNSIILPTVMINENVLQGTCKTLPKIALVRKLNWCKLPKVMEDTKSIPPPSAQPDTQIWAGPCYCISFHCCLCPFLNVKEGPHTEERAHTPQVVSLLPYLDYFFMIVVTLIIYWLYGDNNSPRLIHNADINQQSSIKAKLPPANSQKNVKKKSTCWKLW